MWMVARTTAFAALLILGCASEPATSGVDPGRSGDFTDQELRALCRFQRDLLGDETHCDGYTAPDEEACIRAGANIGPCGYPDVRTYETCIRSLAAAECDHPSCALPLCL